MKAVKAGYKFSIKNPTEAAQILIKAVPELNQELVKQSQFYLSRQYQADSPTWGIQRESVWKNYAQWLVDHKLMKKTIDVKDAFTNDFLK
jgi:ABC-type nitrate/sulfonate/bicarbonate transport system substrate-binding protein